jgi:hypothetical protein
MNISLRRALFLKTRTLRHANLRRRGCFLCICMEVFQRMFHAGTASADRTAQRIDASTFLHDRDTWCK